MPDDVAVEEKSETKMTSKEALEQVFALLGRSTTTAGDGARSAPQVPSARSRAALEAFAQWGSFAELAESQKNLKALAIDLLDWYPKLDGTRATGNVVKAIGAALQATDPNGNSAYPQAVEMLGFAAAAAPLLQPDRLARLIAEAPKVGSAFSPDRYLMSFSTALRTVVERYPEQRRETLLVSLWHAAHSGRWWDLTSAEARRRPAPANPNPELQAAREAAAAAHGAVAAELTQLRERADADILATAIGDTAEGSPARHQRVATRLLADEIPFTEQMSGMMATLPPLTFLRDSLADISEQMRAGAMVYPDKAALVAYIAWATPSERPESPICQMVNRVAQMLAPHPVTGAAQLETLPEKPKKWQDLCPADSADAFPYPTEARMLDGMVMPGGVTVETVKNPQDLADNRDYMRNCTYGYMSGMQKGEYILFRLWHEGHCYNASITSYGGARQRNAGHNGWGVGEVNSRFNQGNVPDVVRAVAEQLREVLPARVAA